MVIRKPDSSLPPEAGIPAEWLEEFEAAARRPLATRLRYAFIRTYKPVLDDAPIVRSTRWKTTGAGAKRTCRIGSDMAAFEYSQAQEIHDAFSRSCGPRKKVLHGYATLSSNGASE